MSDYVCDHVLDGAGTFAHSVIEGTDEHGEPDRLEFEVCAACFGPLLYRVLHKLPEGAACVLHKGQDGDLKVHWEAP